jgi:hypothetical protein
MQNGFDWVAKSGICTEVAYQYTSGNTSISGTCNSTCTPEVKCTGHRDVPSMDEDALYAALTHAPVSVAIEADQPAFQLYKGGILTDSSCGMGYAPFLLDHGVAVVGYGTGEAQNGTTLPYWNVRNSWGATWGEKGYVRMVKGQNQCGIAQAAVQPTGVTGPNPPTPPTPPTPAPPTPPPTPVPPTPPTPPTPSPTWPPPPGYTCATTSKYACRGEVHKTEAECKAAAGGNFCCWDDSDKDPLKWCYMPQH